MTGKILGYDIESNTGTVSGDDGKRYKFSKGSWKESSAPLKEIKVDFDVSEEGNAVDIYAVRDQAAENSTTMLGLLSVGVTFFFAFIGTFISRVFISKEPIGSAIVPTVIHFLATLAAIIPIVGWVIYFIATFYYMYKNYMRVVTTVSSNKYA